MTKKGEMIMKKLIALFTILAMICSFGFTAVAGDETAENYTAIRFSTAGENVKRNLPDKSTGLQLVLEGTKDGSEWTTIASNDSNVEYRSLFNIAKVSETGLVTRVFSDCGNGVVPILGAYKNADGSIVTTKTNVILHDLTAVGFITDFSKDVYTNSKAVTQYQLNGFTVLDSYKYYADSATNKNKPIESGAGANTVKDEGILEFWFYDTLKSANDISVRNGADGNTRDFNMHIEFGTEEYVITEDFDAEANPATLNNIKRSEGWHQVTVMLWGGSTNQVDAKQHVVAYIDGQVIFDKAVTDGTLGVDYMWYVSQYSSSEEAKTYVSDCKYYSTRQNALSTPVVLDMEIKNFVRCNDGSYYVLRNGANASDPQTVDFNSKNLDLTNYVRAQAFYNYYMPGDVQNGGGMRIYDPNSGEKGGTGTTNNDTAYGGKVYTFMTVNSVANLQFNVKVSSTTANDNQFFETMTYNSQTTASGHTSFRLSQPLLYGQDTTTGYYHDITEDGVIGYKKVKAGVRYMNHYDAVVDVCVAIAQYEDGRLVDIYYEDTKFESGTTRDIVKEFTVDDSTKTEFKTFVWRTWQYDGNGSKYAELLRPFDDSNNTTAEAYTFGPFGRK